MGKQDATALRDEDESRAFMKALLSDVRALEHMLETGRCFDGPTRRIGAEQEMFLVDGEGRPAALALRVLESAREPRLTTELALFNLEANVTPRTFEGSCLSQMEREVTELVGRAREAAQTFGADVVLTGILPTLRRGDLTLANMTPNPRYRALNDAILAMRGGDFRIAIRGADEIDLTHDNVMFEACNTSFQVHFQVAPASSHGSTTSRSSRRRRCWPRLRTRRSCSAPGCGTRRGWRSSRARSTIAARAFRGRSSRG